MYANVELEEYYVETKTEIKFGLCLVFQTTQSIIKFNSQMMLSNIGTCRHVFKLRLRCWCQKLFVRINF